MSIQLSVGQLVQRTYVNHPESERDGFVDSLKGALFEITEVQEGLIEVKCVASAGYPPAGQEGWSIPILHLIEPYFILGKLKGDNANG